MKGRNPNLMALFLPTFVDIYDAIHSLKNKKPSGVDTILSYLLKVTFLMITPYLMLLFNVCFENGLFPEVLKVSNSKVIFSYKSGDKTKLNNITDQSIYCHHQWRLVTKMFGGAANVLPYQRLGGFAPQTPLTKATPTL